MSATNNTKVVHEVKFEIIKHFQNRSKRWAAYQVQAVLETFQKCWPGFCTIQCEMPKGVEFGSMIYTAIITHSDRDALIKLRRELECDLRRGTHKDVVYKMLYTKRIEYGTDHDETVRVTGRDFTVTLVGSDGT